MLYSAGSGVKRMHVVLSGLRIRFFASMYVFPVGMIAFLLCLCRMFMSYVYVVCLYVE